MGSRLDGASWLGPTRSGRPEESADVILNNMGWAHEEDTPLERRKFVGEKNRNLVPIEIGTAVLFGWQDYGVRKLEETNSLEGISRKKERKYPVR